MKQTALLSLLLAAVSSGAFAQAPAAPAAPASAPRTVTKAELRACFDTKDELIARNESLKAANVVNNDEAKVLAKESEELKEEQKRVEDGNRMGARDRFDRKVRAYDAKVKALNERVQKLRADAEALSTATGTWNDTCSNISFTRTDREEVEKERAAAGKK